MIVGIGDIRDLSYNKRIKSNYITKVMSYIPTLNYRQRVKQGRGFNVMYSGICLTCKDTFWTSERRRSCCSKRCGGISVHVDFLKGHIDSDGYRKFSAGNRNSKEHIIVMTKLLKRKLRKNEVVHHINHHKTDNRPVNLLLTSSKENNQLNGAVWKYLRKYLSDTILKNITIKALKDIRAGRTLS